MKSETWTIQQVFQDRRQYKVPFYQRPYVWTLQKHWPLLWSDIKEKADQRLAGTAPAPHFLGAIVVEPQEKPGLRGVDTLHIIDGQQRLTTLQYILGGIRLAARELGISDLDSYLAAVLDNPNPSTMADPKAEVFKIWPTFSDQDAFIAAMTADSLDALKGRYPAHFTLAGRFRRIGITHPPALDAIWNFSHWAKEWLMDSGGASALEALVLAVLTDLKVVLIQLEKGDDAQVIFETLNGRGAELHATDLIRNHLFMSVDRSREDSAALYETQWKQFEHTTWRLPERRGRITRPRLEWLIFSAIRAETAHEGDLGRLYVDFKNYAQGPRPLTATEQLAMLSTYGKHYLQLIEGKGELPVARFGRRLMPFDTTTSHPLALRISTANLPDSEKTAMFNDIVSYVVRRAVCGLTPKNYNNWFMSVLRQWIKGEPTRLALKELLGASPNSPASRWPDDAEFTHAFQVAPTYPGNLDASRCRMLLTELEGWLRLSRRTEEPSIPDLSNLDIDHILPRSWYEHWKLPDGRTGTYAQVQAAEVLELSGGTVSEHLRAVRRRAMAIPTLGNLTLVNLSVNREAQHKAFPVKRDLLIANTVLNLNGDLMGREVWEEEAIGTRAKRLAEAAVQLYPR
ncbi:MAG: DUF262 domain-containing HNH endonuclease family protein [Gammaproteobacteria bacterium]|nr:DUF262 domain-containing HNH endonuclease family protein [Gammaproteobacteria bacterium]